MKNQPACCIIKCKLSRKLLKHRINLHQITFTLNHRTIKKKIERKKITRNTFHPRLRIFFLHVNLQKTYLSRQTLARITFATSFTIYATAYNTSGYIYMYSTLAHTHARSSLFRRFFFDDGFTVFTRDFSTFLSSRMQAHNTQWRSYMLFEKTLSITLQI